MPKKDPVSKLPREIWHTILRYSISVPDFFDPDELVDRFPPWVIVNRPRSTFTSYYEAERTRNALQRVCRSWNEYLQRYAHRYVRILDVIHGYVPLHYLETAIRVSLEDDDHHDLMCYDCKRGNILPESEGPDGWDETSNYANLRNHILEQIESLEAIILDHGRYGDLLLPSDGLSEILPNLVCVHDTGASITEYKVINMINSIPALRYLYIPLDCFHDKLLSLKSSTLTTLHFSFTIPDPSCIMFTNENLHLPALRHLYIEECQYGRPDYYDEPAWMSLVKIVGKELRTLFLPGEIGCRMRTVPEAIWKHCPKLEDLALEFMEPPVEPPPMGHPIHTLSAHEPLDRLQTPLQDVPDWPGLRTVRVDSTWDRWKARYGLLESSITEKLALRCISLEDKRGESYIEYLFRGELEKGDSP
jgi:hypothetical protein